MRLMSPSPHGCAPLQRVGALLLMASLASGGAVSAGQAETPRGALPPGTTRATLYAGGPILTMAGPTPSYAESLVERGGRIVYVGSLAGALQAAGAGAQREIGRAHV